MYAVIALDVNKRTTSQRVEDNLENTGCGGLAGIAEGIYSSKSGPKI